MKLNNNTLIVTDKEDKLIKENFKQTIKEVEKLFKKEINKNLIIKAEYTDFEDIGEKFMVEVYSNTQTGLRFIGSAVGNRLTEMFNKESISMIRCSANKI